MRLRTARSRRQAGLLRALVIAGLAALGGTVVWNSLQYSAGQAKGRATLSGQEDQKPRAVSERADVDAATKGSAGESKDAAATQSNLAAWTELTDAGAAAGTEGGGSGGSTRASADGGSAGGGGGSSGKQAGTDARKGEDAATGTADAASGAGYLTVELRVPKTPPTYNSWVLAEDMLLLHTRALQQQLEQVYIGMALAAAAGRGFALPQLACFCQNGESALPRCRRPDGKDLNFPVACPEAEVLVPLEQFSAEPAQRGTPLDVQPASFAQAALKDKSKALVLRPSATILWPACTTGKDTPERCTKESTRQEDGLAMLVLPPSLNDTHLLPLLEPYKQKYPLWVLDLSDVGSHWHAFAGWDCAEPARKFDQRMSKAAKPWPAPAGGGLVQLNMTTGRLYSAEPDMKEVCGGSSTSGGDGAAASSE